MKNVTSLAVRGVWYALVLGVIFGTIYVNGQQALRQGIAEGQYELAHAMAQHLGNGEQLPMNASHVAIESEGGLYTVVYDAQGNPVSGTGYLHDALPHIPQGIFQDVAHGKGRDLLTWQPEAGVRQDIDVVVLPDGKGYVMAGRSLAYAEHEVDSLLLRTAFGFVVAFLLVLVYLVGCYYFKHGRRMPLRGDSVQN